MEIKWVSSIPLYVEELWFKSLACFRYFVLINIFQIPLKRKCTFKSMINYINLCNYHRMLDSYLVDFSLFAAVQFRWVSCMNFAFSYLVTMYKES